jgi:DNA-binding response OmpR family regulator
MRIADFVLIVRYPHFSFPVVPEKYSLMQGAWQMQNHSGTQREISYSDVYDDGFLRIEHANYYIACGGTVLRLARSEFLIVSRLARTPARIVSSAELWQEAWGSSKPYNSVSLHVYMYRLRRKLAPHDLNIETMVNVGYRLIPRVQIQSGVGTAS